MDFLSGLLPVKTLLFIAGGIGVLSAIGELFTAIAKLTDSKKDDVLAGKFVAAVNAVSSFFARVIPTFSDRKK